MNVVPRSRLEIRLRDSLARGIAILVAPAGYGKSTLIAAGVGQHQPSLGLGLEMSVEAWSKRLITRYASSSAGAFADWFDAHRGGAGAAAVVAELLADAGRPVVLDDLHAVPAGSPIWPFLQSLIDQTVPPVQWLLSSRELPPLPIARWVAAGVSALPITGNDFRFTAEEIRDLGARFGVALSDDQLQRAFEATGGWSIALSLWLAGQGWTMDRAAFTRSRAELTSYLATEIWDNLEDADRWILSCQAVADTSNTNAIEITAPHGVRRLQRLSQRLPLFLTADDSQVPRLHALLREFILDRIVETDAYFAAVVEAVAQAFERTGAVTEAVNTALLRGWTALSERLLIAHGCDVVYRREGHTVCAFLRGATAVTSRQQQTRGALLAIERSFEGDLEPMRRHFETWMDSPDAIESLQFPLKANLRRYYLACNQPERALALPYDLNRLETAAQLSDATRVAAAFVISGDAHSGQQLLDILEGRADRVDAVDRDELLYGIAYVNFHLGSLGTDEAYRLCRTILAGNNSAVMKARTLSLLSALSSGRIALEYSNEMLQWAKTAGDTLFISHSLSTVYLNSCFCDAIDPDIEGSATIKGPPKLFLDQGVPFLIITGIIGAIRAGDYRRASTILEQVRPNDPMVVDLMVWRGLVALANGDITTAQRVARSRVIDYQVSDYSTRAIRVNAQFLQALLRWILGEDVVALPIPQWLHKMHRGSFESITGVLRLPRASVTLEQIDRAFDPLGEQGAIGIRVTFTRVIAAAIASVDAHDGATVPLALTPAQEQVLAALRRGESNKAIAARSGRSINTVRTHVAAVLAKTGYKTRAELAANYRP